MATEITTMLSVADKEALGVALNEATLVDVEFDEGIRAARVRMDAFSIGVDESAETARVVLVLESVSQLIASLREGRWDDPAAAVTRFQLSELSSIVRSFGGLPVYGWDFFDVGEQELSRWGDRLSLSWQSGGSATNAHSLALFQDGQTRHLDLCIWFRSVRIEDRSGREIPMATFTEGGRRWWEAFRQNDPRTRNSGMFPLE
jgi:hypothetical protein